MRHGLALHWGNNNLQPVSLLNAAEGQSLVVRFIAVTLVVICSIVVVTLSLTTFTAIVIVIVVVVVVVAAAVVVVVVVIMIAITAVHVLMFCLYLIPIVVIVVISSTAILVTCTVDVVVFIRLTSLTVVVFMMSLDVVSPMMIALLIIETTQAAAPASGPRITELPPLAVTLCTDSTALGSALLRKRRWIATRVKKRRLRGKIGIIASCSRMLDLPTLSSRRNPKD